MHKSVKQKTTFCLYKKSIASVRNFVLDAAIDHVYICTQKKVRQPINEYFS